MTDQTDTKTDDAEALREALKQTGQIMTTEERRSALDRPDVNLVEHSPFMSMHAFGLAQRMATMLSSSSIVPDTYRSVYPDKDGNWIENPAAVGNCFIAIELANRLHLSPLVVMQNVDMIYGRPTLRAKMITGLVNASGQYAHDLAYECNDKSGDEYGYRAWTTSKDGRRLNGPWITWKLVKAEGWNNRKGNKWNTIPEKMFHYRSASWWADLHATHITLGLMESEEAREVFGEDERPNRAQRLNERLEESIAITADAGAAGDPSPEPCDSAEPEKETPKPKRRGQRRAVKTEAEPETKADDAMAEDPEDDAEAAAQRERDRLEAQKRQQAAAQRATQQKAEASADVGKTEPAQDAAPPKNDMFDVE